VIEQLVNSRAVSISPPPPLAVFDRMLLAYGPGLLFRGPSCTLCSGYYVCKWRKKQMVHKWR